VPRSSSDEFSGHLTLPMIVRVTGSQFHFYWSPRDASNRSWIFRTDAYFENDVLDIEWSLKARVLAPGYFGSFDSDGVSGSDVYIDQMGRTNLLYFGWQRLPSGSWINGIGHARGNPCGDFQRVYAGPLLARDAHDQFSVAYPRLVNGDSHQILYSSYTKFNDPRITDDYEYVVRKAFWDESGCSLSGRSNLDLERIPGVSAYSRPTMLQIGSENVLLCSVRGSQYSIRGWVLRGDIWIRATEYDGDLLQDSNCKIATCYQFPFVIGESAYLLYNGDNYGLTGFGLAKWE
jgi:hypothetical protein